MKIFCSHSKLLLLLLFPLLAQANRENPTLFPIGEIEPFLGNTGIALKKSSGSVYYNPAALSTKDDVSFSANGSSYFFQNSSFKGGSGGIGSESFGILPTTFVSSKPFKSFVGAISLLVPDAVIYNDQILGEVQSQTLRSLIQSDTRSLWLGATLSKELAENMRLGVSLFLIRKELSKSSTSLLESPILNQGITVASQTKGAIHGATLIVGGMSDLSENLTVGVRIKTPFLKIKSKAESYQNIKSFTGTYIQSESDLNLEPNDEDPWEFAFGVNWSLTPQFELLSDLSLQLKTSYTDLPNSAVSNQIETKKTLRASFGTRFHWAESLSLLAGLQINPSNLETGLNEGYSKMDYYGVSFGAHWMSERINSGLGAFSLFGKGETSGHVQSLSLTNTVNVEVYGIYASSSFKF